jgi:LacI family transcriptional regulator
MPPLPAKMSSLNAVAAAANVSAMTVSRVLRNSPHVSAATRRLVQRAARKVGYRPNPQIARLMHIVRGAKQQHLRAVIGVVRDDIPEDELHDSAYQYVSNKDIRRRAEQHGYAIEEFFLGRNGLTPARLNGILRARGIEGLIISPQSSRAIGSLLDFTPFAAATFGYGLPSPALHRASTNMTQGILQAVQRLEERGYTRIGLAVTRWIDARADHTYSGAMLHYQQQLPPRQRVPPLFFPDNPAQGANVFVAWMRKYKPDALISLDAYVPEWLTRRLKFDIPADIGLVVHDWTERMTGFAGIHHRRPHVAAAAVDLVATQLMHNEHGVPEVPRQILIPPAWIDGPSIRPGST